MSLLLCKHRVCLVRCLLIGLLCLASVVPAGAVLPADSSICTSEVADYKNTYDYEPYGKMKPTKEFDWSWVPSFSLPSMPDMNSFFCIFSLIVILSLLTVVGIIVGNIYSRKRQKKSAIQEDNTSADSIHNGKMKTELQLALDAGDFRKAVKLIYLASLDVLDSRHYIVWNVAKTPAEYYYELQVPAAKTSLFRLTYLFLDVRYGKCVPDQALVDEALACQADILKQISAER
jgi:hypothetical protein